MSIPKITLKKNAKMQYVRYGWNMPNNLYERSLSMQMLTLC
jgi:hypothetical protein